MRTHRLPSIAALGVIGSRLTVSGDLATADRRKLCLVAFADRVLGGLLWVASRWWFLMSYGSLGALFAVVCEDQSVDFSVGYIRGHTSRGARGVCGS